MHPPDVTQSDLTQPDVTLPEVDLPDAIRDWLTADAAKDLRRMQEFLADSVQIISPLTEQFTFRGPEQVIGVYAAIFEDLTDIEFVRVTGADRDWVLHGRNTFQGRNLEEIQWLQLDDEDRIRQITLFVRPAPAAIAVLATIGRRLHRNGTMGRAAAVASVAATPIALALNQVEHFVMPRLGRRVSSRPG